MSNNVSFMTLLALASILGFSTADNLTQFGPVAFVYPLSSHRAKSRHANIYTKTRLMSFPDAITNVNNNNNSEEIAKQLRQRAQDLRREAIAEEQSLKKLVELKKEQEKREADRWIDLLLGVTSASADVDSSSDKSIENKVENNNSPSAHTLALRIKEHNLISSAKLMKIVERLHDRETSMTMGPEALLSKPETIDKSGDFILGDYENNSLERKVDENRKITGLLDALLEAVQLIDEEGSRSRLAPSLRIRVTELRLSREALLKRRIDGLIESGNGTEKQNLDDFARFAIQEEASSDALSDNLRQEKMLKRLIETPSWLPPSLAPFAASSPVEVTISSWKMIKSDLLANSGFVCTSWDANNVAAVFRGRLSRNALDVNEYDDPNNQMTEIFNKLMNDLERHPGLKDKVQLFLVGDNEWSSSLDNGLTLKEDTGPLPVIIALAKEVMPEQETKRAFRVKALATFSTLTTLLTTLAYALSSFALNPMFFDAVVNQNDVAIVPICIPIFLGVLAVSALHELGHHAAAIKHNVKLGSPVPLPSFQVGSFGCITPLRSFPSSRTAMFDVAMSGPGLTIFASIFMIVTGLSLTTAATSFISFPWVPASVIKSSFLVGLIASVIAPKLMLVPLSQPIPLHALTMVGIAGLIMSAVNLLPIGRLDGGRACMAAFGRKASATLSFLSLLVMAFYSFSGSSGVIIFWSALVVMTQRLADIPAVDEATGVNKMRSNVYICALVLALLTLAPFPI